MSETKTTMLVRHASPQIAIIDISGDVTAAAEPVLLAAIEEASSPELRVLILNFNSLAYMNSIGIGLLVTVLIRLNRQKQHLLAYGLSEHYRHIFHLTRLDEAIGIADNEAAALITAARMY